MTEIERGEDKIDREGEKEREGERETERKRETHTQRKIEATISELPFGEAEKAAQMSQTKNWDAARQKVSKSSLLVKSTFNYLKT